MGPELFFVVRVRPGRLERPTDGFEVRCSIQLSYRRPSRETSYQGKSPRCKKKVQAPRNVLVVAAPAAHGFLALLLHRGGIAIADHEDLDVVLIAPAGADAVQDGEDVALQVLHRAGGRAA